MSDKPTLQEMRENARTNYGITNADDLSEEILQQEMDTIDKQAEDAREEEAKVQRNPDRAVANSVTNPASGASDGNASLDAEGNNGDEDEADEDEDEDGTPVFTVANTRAELEAEAARLEVDGDVTDKELYPNKEALVAAIDEANSQDADDEDEDEEEITA